MTAEAIARTAHAGQVEKYGGADYLTHVQRIVAMVEGADAQMVAWLHDVIEDSAVTAADLRASGIPAHIVDAVVLLTRGPETYATYIDTLRAAQNPLALAVKRADLRDHLRPETAHLLPRSARRRYERALVRLT